MLLAADTAHPKHRNWKTVASEALAGTGIHASRPVHANLTAPALVAEAVRRDEGRLSVDGALMVRTGVHTGRSVQDKFVVDEPAITGDVWWGTVNQPLAPEKFDDPEGAGAGLSAGPGTVHPGPVRRRRSGASRAGALVTTGAWQALFARNMFIRPAPEELADFKPDYVILHAPQFHADPAIDGVRSGTSIALSFAQRMIVIAGTEYAGEIKKSIFTVMNWLLPPQGVLPMHCSANVGARRRRGAVLRPVRHRQDHAVVRPACAPLIGDDEHGWGDGRRVQLRGRLLRQGDQPVSRKPSPRSGPPPTASAPCWRTWSPTSTAGSTSTTSR